MKRRKIDLIVGIAVVLFLSGSVAVFFLMRNASGNGQPARVYPATETGIRQVLETVYDWELDTDIVSLGLVRGVTLDEDHDAQITIIFTTPFCPYAGVMIAQIKKAVSGIAGIRAVTVKVDTSAAWTPELMSDAARQKLKGLFQ